MKLEHVVMQREFKTIYCENEKIVSVFKLETLKSNVLDEAQKQAKAEELGFSVPKIIDVLRLDEGWAIITEKTGGKTMNILMEEHPEKKEEYLAKMVEILKDMHSFHNKSFRTMKTKMEDAISGIDISAVNRFHVLRWLQKLPVGDSLCHADLNPKNVVLTEDGKYYIIDWKHACDGHPDADATVTYLELILQYDKETADSFLRKYQEATNANPEEMKKWLPVCAAFIKNRHQFKNDEILTDFILNY